MNSQMEVGGLLSVIRIFLSDHLIDDQRNDSHNKPYDELDCDIVPVNTAFFLSLNT